MKKLYLLLLFACGLFQYTFAQDASERPKTPIGGRPNIPADLKLEFGFSQMNNRPEDLSVNFFGSRTFNIYYQYPIPIFGKNSGISIDPGIGIGTDKYSFKNGQNLFNAPAIGPESSTMREISAVYGDDITVNRSNFAANYIDIPLDFTYHLNKNNYNKGFRISLGGKVGFLYNAHTKIKYEDGNGLERKIKDAQNYGLEKIRYGLSLRAGSPGFYFWTYYGLNSVFQENRGPFGTRASQFNFGIAVNVF